MTDVFHDAETVASAELSDEETARLRELLDKLCTAMESQNEGKKNKT